MACPVQVATGVLAAIMLANATANRPTLHADGPLPKVACHRRQGPAPHALVVVPKPARMKCRDLVEARLSRAQRLLTSPKFDPSPRVAIPQKGERLNSNSKLAILFPPILRCCKFLWDS